MLHRSRLPPAMVSDPRREKKLPSLLREQCFASDNRCDSVYWLLPPVGPVLRSLPEGNPVAFSRSTPSTPWRAPLGRLLERDSIKRRTDMGEAHSLPGDRAHRLR